MPRDVFDTDDYCYLQQKLYLPIFEEFSVVPTMSCFLEYLICLADLNFGYINMETETSSRGID